MPRIGINAHLLSGAPGYRSAGIHHYIRNTLHHLPKTPNWHYTIYSQAKNELPIRPDFTIQPSHWPTQKRLFRIAWEQAAWPRIAQSQKIDLLHSMAFALPIFSRKPSIVTIYDLSFIEHPDRFPPLQRLYLTAQTRWSCRHSGHILAISQSGRQDIHRIFNTPLNQISVIYPGVDEQFQPLPAAKVNSFRQEKGLPPQFILHIGTLQPRKNIPILIEAFAQLIHLAQYRQSNLKLILVGGKGWLYDDIFARVKTLGLADKVQFTGYVPSHELPLWYNAASLLVFPSLYEGFGLPVIEAMACGTPVIAAETSAIPEAAGEAALTFEPHDKSELVKQLCNVLENQNLAKTMQVQGVSQAKRFTWKKAGLQMHQIYHEVLFS